MHTSLRALPATAAPLRSRVLSSRPRVAAPRSRAASVSAMAGFHDLSIKDINGNEVKFDKYAGKVVLITNVASACGYTRSNYTELAALKDKYPALELVACPCNQFGRQENGSAAEICKFTADKKFDGLVTEKLDVNGPTTHPLWKWLKAEKPGDVGWNFGAKFIIDKIGKVVDRNGDSPAASEAKIKALL